MFSPEEYELRIKEAATEEELRVARHEASDAVIMIDVFWTDWLRDLQALLETNELDEDEFARVCIKAIEQRPSERVLRTLVDLLGEVGVSFVTFEMHNYMPFLVTFSHHSFYRLQLRQLIFHHAALYQPAGSDGRLMSMVREQLESDTDRLFWNNTDLQTKIKSFELVIQNCINDRDRLLAWFRYIDSVKSQGAIFPQEYLFQTIIRASFEVGSYPEFWSKVLVLVADSWDYSTLLLQKAVRYCPKQMEFHLSLVDNLSFPQCSLKTHLDQMVQRAQVALRAYQEIVQDNPDNSDILNKSTSAMCKIRLLVAASHMKLSKVHFERYDSAKILAKLFKEDCELFLPTQSRWSCIIGWLRLASIAPISEPFPLTFDVLKGIIDNHGILEMRADQWFQFETSAVSMIKLQAADIPISATKYHSEYVPRQIDDLFSLLSKHIDTYVDKAIANPEMIVSDEIINLGINIYESWKNCLLFCIVLTFATPEILVRYNRFHQNIRKLKKRINTSQMPTASSSSFNPEIKFPAKQPGNRKDRRALQFSQSNTQVTDLGQSSQKDSNQPEAKRPRIAPVNAKTQ